MYYHLSFLFQTTNLPQDLQFFQTVYHFFHGIFNVSYESLKFQMLDRLFFDKFWSKNLGVSRIYIVEMFSAIHSCMQLLLHFRTRNCNRNYLMWNHFKEITNAKKVTVSSKNVSKINNFSEIKSIIVVMFFL